MFLNKIYSEPDGLFDLVEFKPGVNFIFAKKDKNGDKKKTLNGVGKSLFLNLIDFCLLSEETQHIKSAKNNLNLEEYYVVLEFSVDNVDYIIKRPFKSPNRDILFGRIGGEIMSYNNTKNDKELSKRLCNLIFFDSKYKGKFFDLWLRKLLPFFIKIQTTKEKVNFKDPIKYISEGMKEEDLIPLHLLLLGIDNTLFYQNSLICADIKSKTPALREVGNLVREKYELNDIPAAESEIDKIKNQISSLDSKIRDFQLSEQYKDVENESNDLTEKIKELWYENYNSRQRIDVCLNSSKVGDNINIIKIKNIYNDLNYLLAGNIKKTLQDAVKFRKSIAKYREEFLQNEIKLLNENILKNDSIINALETRRAEIFSFLSAKEAINDLSEAYFDLGRRRQNLADLEGKIKTYQDLNKELSECEAESANLYVEIEKFAQEIKEKISLFRKTFFHIHDAIYLENEGDSQFIFTPNKRKSAKIDMNVVLPSELSYGKNRGRTLIYDLAVLFHAIENNVKCPRFLIHDGIFDGMDKTQFVYLYEFLEKEEFNKNKFQYIITLNEEGTLNGKFGNADKVNPLKIAKEAILTLTPSTPLFKKRWK